jgi:hypothetical protein
MVQARDLALAFSFGNPAPSSKLAVFDFDGTLGNPLTCMGQRCPNDVWDGAWSGNLIFVKNLSGKKQSLCGGKVGKVGGGRVGLCSTDPHLAPSGSHGGSTDPHLVPS